MLKLVFAVAAFAIVAALAAPELTSRILASVEPAQQVGPAEDGAAARVMLSADGRGHFETDVTVNGQPLRALVDTGASMVALTYDDARSLGLVRPGDRFDIEVQTGNGTTAMKRVSLNSVRIGGISVPDVDAMVAKEGVLPMNLLGMSFLRKLRTFQMSNGRLVLEQ
jgi:aspartyl protease family protein